MRLGDEVKAKIKKLSNENIIVQKDVDSVMFLLSLLDYANTESEERALLSSIVQDIEISDSVRTSINEVLNHSKQPKKKRASFLPPDKASAPPISNTSPDLVLPHPKIDVKRDVFVSSTGREISAVSPSAYFKLRDMQIRAVRGRGPKIKLRNMLFTPQTHPKLGLKYPIFLGKNGEMIAIMRLMPEDETFKLGEGGMGTVFLGMNVDTGKPVAIKIVMSEQLKKEIKPHQANDFRNEVKMLENLSRLQGALEQNNDLILVDEYVAGKTYLSILEDSNHIGYRMNVSPESTLFKMRMALQFLENVEKLHQQNMIHGDIKLDNGMLAKFIDFGFALSRPKPPEEVVYGQEFRGTPIYMAPEIAAKGAFSVNSDIYASGVGLIELFTQTDLFSEANYAAWFSVINQYKTTGKADFASFFQQAVPELFNTVPPEELSLIVKQIQKMVAVDPKQRPQLVDTISIVRGATNSFAFKLFEKKVNSPVPLVITKEDMDNPLIKSFIFKNFKNPKLNKIHKDSIYAILSEAAKENNVAVFNHFAPKFSKYENGLSHPKNKGFADALYSISIKNAKSIEDLIERLKNIPEMKDVVEEIDKFVKNKENIKKLAKGETFSLIPSQLGISKKIMDLAKKQQLDEKTVKTFLNTDLKTLYYIKKIPRGARMPLFVQEKTQAKTQSPAEELAQKQLDFLQTTFKAIDNDSELTTKQKAQLAYAVLKIIKNQIAEETAPVKILCQEQMDKITSTISKESVDPDIKLKIRQYLEKTEKLTETLPKEVEPLLKPKPLRG